MEKHTKIIPISGEKKSNMKKELQLFSIAFILYGAIELSRDLEINISTFVAVVCISVALHTPPNISSRSWKDLTHTMTCNPANPDLVLPDLYLSNMDALKTSIFLEMSGQLEGFWGERNDNNVHHRMFSPLKHHLFKRKSMGICCNLWLAYFSAQLACTTSFPPTGYFWSLA